MEEIEMHQTSLEASILSEETKENINKLNIELNELEEILREDMRFIYRTYKYLQKSAFSQEEIDSLFLRDVKVIYQNFVALREKLHLLRLEDDVQSREGR
jgi:hypothetical protein